ncbi:MAG: NADH pyrophosphatase [Burkholderiaceae bacterium]|nr:NADH pyrophosphatase [Burkholderiaceae bacterium]
MRRMPFTYAVRPDADPTPEAWCFAFVDDQLVVPDSEATPFAPQTWQRFEASQTAQHYLGRLDGIDCRAFALSDVPAGCKRMPLRAAMMALGEPLMNVAGCAAQVIEWDRSHRYCGVCGTATEPRTHERARRCPACGHTSYPRLSPAMMVLVWRAAGSGAAAGSRTISDEAGAALEKPNGYEVLLARSPHYAPGVYSALAGFVEPGESLERCIHREVLEEVGVQVTDLRYYGSQNWPFPHSLMVAYTARWVSGAIVRQEDEIEDANWYPLDALPKIPPRFSISGHLIRDTVVALGGPEPQHLASPVVAR